MSKKVVIVGAGISGLTTAFPLVDPPGLFCYNSVLEIISQFLILP